ncbi:hypothetical protein WJX73_001771 [Symbiochloris irregularis]|uniref:Xrn1 N-terminal domain-containing protein n=1 Tax=Symbiochloris irregularis TaxID=706552 RepID=A0AAW1P5R4_9CHLO
MGVAGLNTWFQEQLPAAHKTKVRDRLDQRIDHVYIDVPTVIHSVIRQAKTPRKAYVGIYAKLDQILRACRPVKSVVIAMDGPAPLAKLLTQRQRRLAEDRSGKETIHVACNSDEPSFGRLGLTPGCLLLATIQDALVSYIAQRIRGGRYPGVHFELSGADAPGEGELKVLHRILNPWADVQPADTHIVFGGDSDVVLMAMFLDNVQHVNILSASQPIKGRSQGFMTLFSMDALEGFWRKKYPFVTDGATMHTLKRDLAFLAIVSGGNDYLPGLRMSLTRVWRQYTAMRAEKAWSDRHIVHKSNGIVSMDAHVLLELLIRQGGGPHQEPASTGPSAGAVGYLEAVRWVLEMYAGGLVSDWRFSYPNHGPSISNLISHLRSFIGRRKPEEGPLLLHSQPLTQTAPVAPAAFAMSLLPPRNGPQFAPTALQHLMREGSPIAQIYDICPQCTALYEAAKTANAALLKFSQRERQAARGDISQRASPEVNRARDKVRQAFKAQDEHNKAAHPFRPLPIDRIEAAVQAVPASQYPPHERRLMHFGPSYRFWALEDKGGAGAQPIDLKIHSLDSGRPAEMFSLQRLPLITPALPRDQADQLDFANGHTPRPGSG